MAFLKSKSPYKVGDWVRIKKHNGRPDLVKKAVGAKVTSVDSMKGELTVSLYNEAGAALYGGYYIDSKDVEPIAPVFKSRLDHIPNTAEAQAIKDEVYRTAMYYAEKHNLCGIVGDALKELGIERPDAGTVTASVTFQVTSTSIEEVGKRIGVRDLNATNFDERFEALSFEAKVDALLGLHTGGSVTWSAKVEKPIIVPAPAATEATNADA